MAEDSAAEAEEKIKALLADEKIDEALAETLRVYGPRIFRMMMGVLRDESKASDVYQQFSIELWKSLPNFKGESKVYTWAYTVARRAIGHKLRGKNREQRLGTQEQGQIQEWARTATVEWRKTAARDKFHEMCEALDERERTLVMLRIGEEMAWAEMAQVMHEGDEPLSAKEAKVSAASLRKQFQRVKDKLRKQL